MPGWGGVQHIVASWAHLLYYDCHVILAVVSYVNERQISDDCVFIARQFYEYETFSQNSDGVTNTPAGALNTGGV